MKIMSIFYRTGSNKALSNHKESLKFELDHEPLSKLKFVEKALLQT